MVQQKNRSTKKADKTVDKRIGKKTHKKGGVISKDKGKATKAKIDKLNADIEQIQEIQQLAAQSSHAQETKQKFLDVKQLKTDLSEQQEKKAKEREVENDISKQLELITGMGL